MSEPIKPGDLVVVIRGSECCGTAQTVGYIGRVISGARYPITRCPVCQTTHPSTNEWLLLSNDMVYTTRRLKRIPPLGELEGEKQKEDQREPA